MPRYAFTCFEHGEILAWFSMGDCPAFLNCPTCHLPAQRAFSFYHQEDRRHMRKGTSVATGLPFAGSRAEERAIEAARGIQFIGPGELTTKERAMREYAEHRKHGGEIVPTTEFMEKPEPSRTLVDLMRERNYRRSEISHDPTPEHQERQLRAILDKTPAPAGAEGTS